MTKKSMQETEDTQDYQLTTATVRGASLGQNLHSERKKSRKKS